MIIPSAIERLSVDIFDGVSCVAFVVKLQEPVLALEVQVLDPPVAPEQPLYILLPAVGPDVADKQSSHGRELGINA